MQAVGKADEVFAVEAEQRVWAVLLAPGAAEDFVGGQLAGVAFQRPLALADEFREGLFAEATGSLGEGEDAGFAVHVAAGEEADVGEEGDRPLPLTVLRAIGKSDEKPSALSRMVIKRIAYTPLFRNNKRPFFG